MLISKGLRGGYNIARNINRIFVRHYKVKFKDGGDWPTFNDCPIPEGCWYEANARKQTLYNIVFFSGIGAFAGSIALVAFSGMMEFNMFVPDYPYKDDSEEVEEDEDENGKDKKQNKDADKNKDSDEDKTTKAVKHSGKGLRLNR